jgi:hypothetical protein
MAYRIAEIGGDLCIAMGEHCYEKPRKSISNVILRGNVGNLLNVPVCPGEDSNLHASQR